MRSIAFCSHPELCRGSLVDWEDQLVAIGYEPSCPRNRIYLYDINRQRFDVKRLD